jgi:hypothetical protein
MGAQPTADPNQGMYHLLSQLPFQQRVRVWQQAMMEAGPQGRPTEAMIDSLVVSYNKEVQAQTPQQAGVGQQKSQQGQQR